MSDDYQYRILEAIEANGERLDTIIDLLREIAKPVCAECRETYCVECKAQDTILKARIKELGGME